MCRCDLLVFVANISSVVSGHASYVNDDTQDHETHAGYDFDDRQHKFNLF